MTSENKAPDRIWATEDRKNFGEDRFHSTRPMQGLTEYVRADLYAAQADEIARLTAERDAAMAGAVNVKPLVWFEVERSRHGGKYTADGYTIRYIEGLWLLDFAGQSKSIWRFPTIELAKAAAQADYEARVRAALQPDPGARQADLAKAYGPILDLLPDAVRAAEKAMRKYPQPNYVISKWAEETGEVTKDLIHMAEGRQTADKLRGEIVQSLAMLHRLMVEGDQVHGLPPVGPAIRALTPADATAALARIEREAEARGRVKGLREAAKVAFGATPYKRVRGDAGYSDLMCARSDGTWQNRKEIQAAILARADQIEKDAK